MQSLISYQTNPFEDKPPQVVYVLSVPFQNFPKRTERTPMRPDIKFASPHREAEATCSKQFAPKSNQARYENEPKSNRKRTTLANQPSAAAQKRRKTGSKANQNRIKSRKFFANACKFASAKTEKSKLKRTDRTKRARLSRFISSQTFFHCPSLLIRQTTC